jgi:hypothetical protein
LKYGSRRYKIGLGSFWQHASACWFLCSAFEIFKSLLQGELLYVLHWVKSRENHKFQFHKFSFGFSY